MVKSEWKVRKQEDFECYWVGFLYGVELSYFHRD